VPNERRRIPLTSSAGTPPQSVEVVRALTAIRQESGAALALLFAALAGGQLDCIAVDIEPTSWWANLAPLLLGTQLRRSATLIAARRQNRAVVVPTAELAAATMRGGRDLMHDLPPWAAVLPLAPGRGIEGCVVLLTQQPLSAATAAELHAQTSAIVTGLVRVLGPQGKARAEASAPLGSSLAATLTPPPATAHSSATRDDLRLLTALPLVGVIVVNGDRTIAAANAAGYETLAALQGAERRSIVHQSLRELLASPLPAAPREIATPGDDGSRRYLRAAASPLAGGQVLIALQDVTEERLMHERLLQSEKMASIGQLVSGVAHELNNPLTGIMGFAQLLLTRDDLPADMRRELTTVFEEAERAARIVQNLLSFARRRRAEKESVDLNEIVARALELRAYELRVHNIEPRLNLKPRLRPIHADPHQIQQVLLNVIRNAEQAICERGGPGTITIATSEHGGFARLTVTDDGAGIPSEHLRRIFDPFFTTKPPGEGTGLGLTIVYGIIEEHGGRISAESEVGKGTTLQIELPFASGATTPGAETPASATRRQPSGKAILVIDDEASIREVLFVLLARDGHDVETVEDGAAALERLAERDFDLIITDVRMPGIDGIELYERVRAWNPAVADRIVFTTGDTINPKTRDFLATVRNPQLQKPFSLADVRALIDALSARDRGY